VQKNEKPGPGDEQMIEPEDIAHLIAADQRIPCCALSTSAQLHCSRSKTVAYKPMNPSKAQQ
jgi:hypothetical protein